MSRVLRHALVLACALLPLSLAAHAQDAFYTTGTHTIDAANSVVGRAFVGLDSSFSPRDSMGNPYNSNVNVVMGGSVGSTLYASNSSTVTVSGGSIGGGLYASDTSMFTVSGGSIGFDLLARGSGTFTISGGAFSGDVNALDSSTITVSGGSFGGTLYAFDTTLVTVSGGSFSSFLDDDFSSTVTVSGGTYGQYQGVNFLDDSYGIFTLVGNNLTATIISPNFTYAHTQYALTGTLQSGTNLSGYVLSVHNGSTFILQTTNTTVPEPGSLALLMGMTLTGSMWVRRRRR